MTLHCPTRLGHSLGQHGVVHLKWIRDPSTGHAMGELLHHAHLANYKGPNTGEPYEVAPSKKGHATAKNLSCCHSWMLLNGCCYFVGVFWLWKVAVISWGACRWLLGLPGGFCMVAVISWRLLHGCMDCRCGTPTTDVGHNHAPPSCHSSYTGCAVAAVIRTLSPFYGGKIRDRDLTTYCSGAALSTVHTQCKVWVCLGTTSSNSRHIAASKQLLVGPI